MPASLVNSQLVAVFGVAPVDIEITEVNLRSDSLREQVQSQRHQVDVSGALAVAEETPLNAISTRHVAKLSRSNRRSPVIVRVQTQDHVLSVVQVA